jgi:hypothetical protein
VTFHCPQIAALAKGQMTQATMKSTMLKSCVIETVQRDEWLMKHHNCSRIKKGSALTIG